MAHKKTVKDVMTKSKAAKEAHQGKDMGAKGKNFDKIAAKAGGGEKGKRIAGSVFWKKLKKGTL